MTLQVQLGVFNFELNLKKGPILIFLASQDALEVMGVTESLTESLTHSLDVSRLD